MEQVSRSETEKARDMVAIETGIEPDDVSFNISKLCLEEDKEYLEIREMGPRLMNQEIQRRNDALKAR